MVERMMVAALFTIVAFSFAPILHITLASDVVIMGGGLVQYDYDELELKFFIEMFNSGSKDVYDLSGRMSRCCLKDIEAILVSTTDSLDCMTMTLSDDVVAVASQNSTNLTLAFPNFYIYDRIGVCYVDILDGDEWVSTAELQFNTTLPYEFNLFMDYTSMGLSGFTGQRCVTPDLDPFRGCEPVVCELKYGGHRNIFAASIHRCIAAAGCPKVAQQPYIMDQNILAHVWVLNPLLNKCKDLRLHLYPVDKDFFNASHTVVNRLQNTTPNVTYTCVNGVLRVDGDGCLCNSGWGSQIGGPNDPYNARTHSIRLCDRAVRQKKAVKQRDHKYGVILATTAVLAILFIVILFLALFYDQSNGKPANPAAQPLIGRMNSKKHGFASAHVHTPNPPLVEDELRLDVGDVITDLHLTEMGTMWKGTCNGVTGVFDEGCVNFIRDDHDSDEEIALLAKNN